MTIIPLDIYKALRDAIGDEAFYTPASVDLQEMIDFVDIQDIEIDVHDLLARERYIGILWGVEDVQKVRPDLDDDLAWQVLQTVKSEYDAAKGVTWKTLKEIAARQIANCHRITRCDKALAVYDEPDLTDLLADAMHWCQKNGPSFEDALRVARDHFQAETDTSGE